MQQRMYNASAEFKNTVTTILQTKKFSTVFPYMNLVNRDGFTYTEDELNQIVQFLGEFAYNEVSDFFKSLPTLVTEFNNQPETVNSEAMPAETM